MIKKACSFALLSSMFAGTALAGPNDYDGVWNATVACGPSIYNEAAYSYERRITIANGTFAFSRERLLWHNRFNTTVRNIDNFTGRVENGVLTVTGKGSADQIDIPAWHFNFSGPAANNQAFDLKGHQMQDGSGMRPAAQNRSCSFAMKLVEPAAMSLAGVETSRAATPTSAALGVETIRQVQAALQLQGLYGGAIDGVWGRGTEAAVKEWQRRGGLNSQFDAAQASTLIQSQQAAAPQPAPSGDLSEKERQLAQRERELAEREKRLEALKANQQAEQDAARRRAEADRARQLAERQKQLDAKEQQIANQERAVGAPPQAPVPQAGRSNASPFIGSWCSLSPGGSLSKMDIHKVEGQSATGHYKYNGLPTQVDEPITGTLVDGVFKSRIGNISWTLARKGSNLEGTAANRRTGNTAHMTMKPC